MGKWHIFWYLSQFCSYIKMAQLYRRSTNTEKTKDIYCEILSCHIALLATWIWAYTRILEETDCIHASSAVLHHPHFLYVPNIKRKFHSIIFFQRTSTLSNRLPYGCFPEEFSLFLKGQSLTVLFIFI